MKIKVWDLPLRLFHWLLVLAIVVAFVTAKVGGNAMDWHGRAGLFIIGLLAFRVVWGFVGSTHSRFASFVRGPSAILAYLGGRWKGIGHNPLGALSVLGLLGALSLQGATGLFANDDIAFQGYLYPLVGANLSEKITEIHEAGEKLLIVLVALHLGAIAFYMRVRKHNLAKPMVTGWTEAEPPVGSPRGGGLLAFIVAAAIGAAAAYAASGALLPPPPPPAAVETPAW